MSINTVVHINLRGDARAEDGLEFYQSVFGGNLVVVTYEDAHNVQNPDEADQIMWGEVVSDDGFRVMACDVPSATAFDQGEIAYFVSVRGKSADEPTGTSSAPRARSRRRWRPPASRPSTAWSPTSSVSPGSSTSPSSTTRPRARADMPARSLRHDSVGPAPQAPQSRPGGRNAWSPRLSARLPRDCSDNLCW